MSTLRVAVSARALFDLEESHQIFLGQGIDAFIAHTKSLEDVPLSPGVAFPLVKGLLKLNTLVDTPEPIVDVIVVSSFSPDAGTRILKSISHHGLPSLRASFVSGKAPVVDYLEAYQVDLLLSKSPEDAQAAVRRGIAAAIMYNPPTFQDLSEDPQIRIAFDGDAVIFSDESERFYKKYRDLPKFMEHEKSLANHPMEDGPFDKVLRTIHELQKYKIDGREPFRIALVTARGGEARERVLKTFDAWKIKVAEAHFLSGFPKAGILKAFRPHIFFDDQAVHVGPASEFVASGLVPWILPLEESADKAA